MSRFPRRIAALRKLALLTAACATVVGTLTVINHSGAQAEPSGDGSALSASQQAQATGRPVPIDSATDANSTTTALPDGTFQRVFTSQPARIERDGAWIPIDATLQQLTDGSLATAATPTAVRLSGGGSGPLATMSHDGDTLSLTWPTTLPTPVVDGNSARYPDVLPDVDLKVTATEQGEVSEVLIVKTPAAAKNPALDSLRVGTSGVTISEDSAGNLTARDGTGQSAFHASTPLMWDSGSTGTTTPDSSTDPATAPPPNADVAKVDVTVASGSVTLTPNQTLLEGADTQYPVYIDPTWHPVTKSPSGYVWVQEAHPNTSWWNTTANGDPAVGYQGWDCCSIGRNRSYFQFDIGSLGQANINTAILDAYENYTGLFDCNASYQINAHSTAHVGSTTTWNNQPTAYTLQDSTMALGAASGCPARHVQFDVKNSVANDTDQLVTIRLSAQSETDKNYYRRFSAANTTLSVTYNWPPNMPTSFAFNPAPTSPACSGSGSYGWIGATNQLTTSAYISDPDHAIQNIGAHFELWDKGGSGTAASTFLITATDPAGSTGYAVTGNGGTVSKTLAVRDATGTLVANGHALVNGHLYGSRATATDGIDQTGPSPNCYFWYDNTAPINVDAVSPDVPTDTSSKRVGQQITFKLSATDVVPSGANFSGIDHYIYSTSSAADLANDGGTHVSATTASITLTLTNWSTNFLHVQAVDKAGNQSATFSKRYYVPDDPTATVTPGDVDADHKPDLLGIDTSTNNLDVLPTAAPYPAYIRVASGAGEAPDGVSWNGTLIAHWISTIDNRVDDLFALKIGATKLWLYKNDAYRLGGLPNSGYSFTNDNRTEIERPGCITTATNDCTTYAANWASVKRMIAPGDLDGDGRPDLITEEVNAGVAGDTGTLWFLHGASIAGQFANPLLISSTGPSGGWTNWRLISPGDVTGDAIPDLWVSDARTVAQGGTGKLYMYPITLGTSPVGDQTISLGAAVSNNYTSGWGPDHHYKVASAGDINGDGKADVISIYVDTGYDIRINHGSVLNNSTFAIDPSTVLDSGNWQRIAILV